MHQSTWENRGRGREGRASAEPARAVSRLNRPLCCLWLSRQLFTLNGESEEKERMRGGDAETFQDSKETGWTPGADRGGRESEGEGERREQETEGGRLRRFSRFLICLEPGAQKDTRGTTRICSAVCTRYYRSDNNEGVAE